MQGLGRRIGTGVGCMLREGMLVYRFNVDRVRVRVVKLVLTV